MSKVVPADIDINKEIATGAIFEAFNLEVKKITLMGEGWDNLVYLVNGELVFRFSRRKIALPLIKREMWVLKHIALKFHEADFLRIRIEFTLSKLKTYIGLARVSEFSITKKQWLEWHEHEVHRVFEEFVFLLKRSSL